MFRHFVVLPFCVLLFCNLLFCCFAVMRFAIMCFAFCARGCFAVMHFANMYKRGVLWGLVLRFAVLPNINAPERGFISSKFLGKNCTTGTDLNY